MFQRFLTWIREVLNKMFNPNDLKSKLGVDVLISPQMVNALQLWSLMYEGRSPWLTDETESLNLPPAIAAEIARAVTIEMTVDISGSPRADFLAEQIKPILERIRQDVESGCAKGGLWWKPYVKGKGIAVDTVQADQGFPISFDSNQNPTACVFVDQRKQDAYWYTRLEKHELTSNGYEIYNTAFKSSDQNTLGSPAPLADVPDWADLQPYATILNVTAPLFGYFRFPFKNNIDPTSPLPISCYGRAQDGKKVKLIQRADEIFSNLVWEFESGARALYVDSSAISKDTNGNLQLAKSQKRLIRTLNQVDSPGLNETGFYQEWSPEFREAAIKAGLNDVLRQIEFACGMSYGVLSDPQVQALTATEVKTTQQRFYSTVADTQKKLENAFNGLLYAMDTYATIYNLAPRGTYVADYEFDDSIIVDDAIQAATDKTAVDMGAMSLLEWRMKTYGETKEVAQERLKEAQQEQAQKAADQLAARVNAVRLGIGQNQPTVPANQ